MLLCFGNRITIDAIFFYTWIPPWFHDSMILRPGFSKLLEAFGVDGEQSDEASDEAWNKNFIARIIC